MTEDTDTCKTCKSFRRGRCYHRMYLDDHPDGLELKNYKICTGYEYEEKTFINKLKAYIKS